MAGEKDPAGKARTTVTSRNNHAVRIYPDPVRRMMHVAAKDNGKDIEFFVFDVQGTLMRHFKIASGEREKITGLERGKYIYNVFSGDEETAAGEFEIR
ncbi:MAG: T9SS type A sorting domain-containing protein [Chitinophagaceae bacterium]